jgi:hypothetical protein
MHQSSTTRTPRLPSNTIHLFYFDQYIKAIFSNVSRVHQLHQEVYGNEFFHYETKVIKGGNFKSNCFGDRNIIFFEFNSENGMEPRDFTSDLDAYLVALESMNSFHVKYKKLSTDDSNSTKCSIIDSKSNQYLTDDNSEVKFYDIGSRTLDFMEFQDESIIRYIYYDTKNCLSRIVSHKLNQEIFPELSFIEKVNISQVPANLIQTTFTNIFYETKSELQKVVSAISTAFSRLNTIQFKHLTIASLTEYFKTNYELGETNEKIKSSALFDQLLLHFKCKLPSDSNKLKLMIPIVLRELKVEKKRQKDGNYWIGIKKKRFEKPRGTHQPSAENDLEEKLQSILEGRNKKSEPVISSTPEKFPDITFIDEPPPVQLFDDNDMISGDGGGFNETLD